MVLVCGLGGIGFVCTESHRAARVAATQIILSILFERPTIFSLGPSRRGSRAGNRRIRSADRADGPVDWSPISPTAFNISDVFVGRTSATACGAMGHLFAFFASDIFLSKHFFGVFQRYKVAFSGTGFPNRMFPLGLSLFCAFFAMANLSNLPQVVRRKHCQILLRRRTPSQAGHIAGWSRTSRKSELNLTAKVPAKFHGEKSSRIWLYTFHSRGRTQVALAL